MKTKTFDCVEMKRKGAERIMKNIDSKDAEQQLRYWQKNTKELRSLQNKARQK